MASMTQAQIIVPRRFWAILILIWYLTIVLVMMMHRHVDLMALAWIRSIQTPFLFQCAEALTYLGRAEWSFLLAFWLWKKKKHVPHLMAMAKLVWMSTLLSGCGIQVLKFFFGRARPKMWIEDAIYGFDFWRIGYAFSSFPSGHAATIMGTFLALALTLPRYKYALIALGLLIAVTRIFVCAHYPSDVLAGLCLGATCTWLLYCHISHDQLKTFTDEQN
jgi:membrane-associated phospholipid phosphatase